MHQLKDNRPSIKSRVTIRLGFPRHVLFFRLQSCVQGGFFNFPKMSRFMAFVESLWWIRVLLIFEPTQNAWSRRKLLEVKWVQQSNKFFFTGSGSKSDDAVLAAAGAFSFHTMKHNSSYNRAGCTSVLLKIIFPDSEIACKFPSVWTKTSNN